MIKQLLYQNTADVLGREVLNAKIDNQQQLHAYIGFAPTGIVHLGYMVPCMKVRDISLAGVKVAVMIADQHAILDERRTPRAVVGLRSKYYKKTLKFILRRCGANMENIKFVLGSDFQHNPEYVADFMELASNVTIASAKKAGSEVVKQNKDPMLGSVMYPLMQVIDEKHVTMHAFGAATDFELGGLDQRKIFAFSYDRPTEETKISYIMNPIVSLNKTGKMSASDPNGKILFTDDPALVTEKIKRAFCPDGDSNCGIMNLLACLMLIQPVELELGDETKRYTTFQQLEADFMDGTLRAQDVKRACAATISTVIEPIGQFVTTERILDIIAQAY